MLWIATYHGSPAAEPGAEGSWLARGSWPCIGRDANSPSELGAPIWSVQRTWSGLLPPNVHRTTGRSLPLPLPLMLASFGQSRLQQRSRRGPKMYEA